MSILTHCNELIRYSAARKPLLLIPKDKLDEFLREVAGDVLMKKVSAPWRCAATMTGAPFVVDMQE